MEKSCEISTPGFHEPKHYPGSHPAVLCHTAQICLCGVLTVTLAHQVTVTVVHLSFPIHGMEAIVVSHRIERFERDV